MSDLSWGDDQIGGDENFTEEDLSTAEAMGKTPLGKFLCTCVESTPVQQNFKDYSCIAANLKWRIDSALEIEGSPIEGDEGDVHIGKFLFDRVNMAHPSEPDFAKNRRLLIAKRVGLISESSGTITKEMWATGIVGKSAILTYEDKFNKKSNKTFRNVAFDGYESVTDAATAPTDDFEEI